MAADEAIDLRRALENGEIIPFFQPLVELRTGLLYGFEVLARWKHPVRGLILPGEFIPLAEKTGLNGLLTGTLLQAVFAAAPNIPENLSLSVNISLTQLADRTLPRHIQAAAAQANFPLNRLILEITENALLDNPEQSYLIANQLKEQGSRLALDDFGTGYSSLSHLQALPFDELKVDASFVRSMTHTRESRKIAAAIIGLGNSLDLVTVAEGVENHTHADMLLWLGCEVGQGWLYGRPVPSEELPAMLAESVVVPSSGTPPIYVDSLMPLRHEALPTQRLAQLHAIYDGVPVGLFFLDRNLRYVSVNKHFAEMDNIPIAQHLGRSVAELFPGIFKKFEPYLNRALRGEAIMGIEIHEIHPRDPNHFITCLISYQPARDEVDEVIGVLVAVVDISERKQVEEALAKSEEHLRYTVELNPQVLWSADSRGMVLSVSERWEKLTGFTKAQALGQGWLRVLHPDDREPTRKAWSEAIRTGNLIDIECRMCDRDGIWHWMRARSAPRYDDAGEIVRWYGTVEDIELQKKTHEALTCCENHLQAALNSASFANASQEHLNKK